MATILFDDTADTLVLGEGTVYKTLTSNNFIGGSAVVISSGSLNFTFSGIAISLFGRTNNLKNDSSPSTSSTRNVPVHNIGEILMDGIPIESNVTLTDQVAIGLIYQLPELPDSKHVLTLSSVSFVILDFIQVTAGNTTPLSGSTLLLSSSDSAISYEGNWTHNDTIVVGDAHQHRQPIGGATRDTTFGDASATVSFTGSSISVLGTRYSDPRASYSPAFYVDGKEQSYQSPRRSGPNYPWFSSQQFSNGNHVLKINLSGNTPGARFSLEYITYTASFENLDTTQNSPQIPASVLIGVGIGAGVIVCGILLVILVWWKRRRRRLSDTATIPTDDTSGLPRTAHPNRDPGRMNQLVEKPFSQTYSARVLTPHDLSVVRASSSTRNETSISMGTGHGSRIDNRSTQVQGLSYDQQEQMTKPLVPRRKRLQAQHHDGPSHRTQISNPSSTETSTSSQIQQLQQIILELEHEMVLPGLATHSHRPQDLNRDLSAHPQNAVNGANIGTGITHNVPVAEGYYGMRVQQLEELMRELREGSAHSELGQDQVGTGHSMTLAGLMEEILELRRSQTRGSERSPVSHRNVI